MSSIKKRKCLFKVLNKTFSSLINRENFSIINILYRFSVNADEYAQLLGNFIEVVETHEELLAAMESSNDRIGKLFLSKAATMKCIHQAYCAAHPRAIVILDKYSEQLEAYMERQGAASPGLLVLTTGLSKPFRRLDKYAAMLQELERHMESGHPDRGDTQRSISIYKDIAVGLFFLFSQLFKRGILMRNFSAFV